MRRSAYASWFAAVAVAYFLAAELGLRLSFTHGNVTPVFPAAGVAVAGLLLGGRGLWPAVFVGALAAHLRTDVPVATAFAMSGGAPLGAFLAATALRHPALRFDLRLADVRSAVSFVAAGVALPAVVSATWGVSALVLGDVVPRSEFGTSWWVWCVGDAMGAVVTGSLLLVARSDRGVVARRPLEAALLTSGSVLAAGLLFFLARDGEVLLLPLVVLLAVRLEARWTVSAVFAIALLAAGATSSDRGPFSDTDVHQSLVHLSVFLAAATLTGLVLSAAVAERDRAHRRLGRVNEELERRVADRTRDLEASQANLQTVVEHVTEAVAFVGPDGVTTFANPSAELLLGVRADEPFEARVAERAVGDGAAAIANAMSAWTGRTGPGPLVQLAVTLPDGSERHIEAVGENLVGDPTVGAVIVTARDVTGYELKARNLWQQARRDALTGLPNRRQFVEELTRALERRQRVGVLFADLDGLKAVNDSFGHAGGDRLLAAIGERLQTSLRSGDLAARLAGDEFTVLAYGVASEADALAAGTRFLGVLSQPFQLGESTVQVTASIGVAVCDGGDAEEALRVADAAMYEAKRAGGAGVAARVMTVSAPDAGEAAAGGTR